VGWIKRHRRIAVGAGIGFAGFIVFVLVWFQPQKLFIDDRVDEALPTAATTTTADPDVTTTGGTTTTEGTTTTIGPAGPTTVAMGEFVDVAHAGSGTAVLLELEDGSYVLRLEDLDVLNGPDLRVILSDRPIAGADDYADGVYLDLGALKGNIGNQNYEIPEGVDLSEFTTAAIWCRRFDTTFNAAPLTDE